MVLLRKFERLDAERYQLQGEVEAKYAVFERDGRGFVQINTYGSPDREMPGKLSQTIQLDREGAIELVAILRKAFAIT
ncbi:methionyl-tRNA formyltransferase [Devosia aquimaris]|uniref:methionyl-tRNA formyltransferase n=1 Tax=Devosia aquimaris TaxID=2866214 RepID=UPI001CD06520|nr:methionyl-tRNA formyltransferase [Devosia sp. CJK-A8-3]